jgi:hypothetical protein
MADWNSRMAAVAAARRQRDFDRLVLAACFSGISLREFTLMISKTDLQSTQMDILDDQPVVESQSAEIARLLGTARTAAPTATKAEQFAADLDLNAPAAPSMDVAAFLLINGTPRNDIINGSGRADEIHGLGGSDTIDGKGGNDSLYGG